MRRWFILCWLSLMISLGTGLLYGATVKARYTARMAGISMADMISTEYTMREKNRYEAGPSNCLPFVAAKGADQAPISIVRLDRGIVWRLFPVDSTYSEQKLSVDIGDMDPMMANMQSIDSSMPAQQKPAWRIDSTTRIVDTISNILCYGIRTVAVVESNDGTASESSFVTCEFLVAPESALGEDLWRFNDSLSRMAGEDKDYRFALAGDLLSTYSLTTSDMGIDTLDGYPVRISVVFEAVIPPESEAADADAGTGDSSAVLPDSQPSSDTIMPDTCFDPERDSATKAFWAQLRAAIKPGRLELIAMTYEITSIDTTALPDSLFEIPAGYTRR